MSVSWSAIARRPTTRFSAALIWAALLPSLLGAQTVEEILAANLQARGGETAWASVRTLRMTTMLNLNGREFRLSVLRKGPDRVRMEKEFPGREEIFVFDGKRGWIETSEGVREARLDEIASRIDEVDLYLPWLNLWDRFERVEYAGQGEVDGEPAHHLRVHLGRDAVQDWWLSTETHHVVKSTRSLIDRRGERTTFDTYQFDHREVEGLVFPHYVEMDFGTALISEIPETIEVNPELSESLFAIPK